MVFSSVKFYQKIGVLLSGLIFSAAALSHVKWFVEEQSAPVSHVCGHTCATLFSLTVLVIVFFYFIEYLSLKNEWVNKILYKPFINGRFIELFLKLSIATFLMGNILLGYFVAPNFSEFSNNYTELAQALLLVLLVVDAFYLGAVLVLFSIGLVLVYPISHSVDYAVELFVLGAALLITQKQSLKIALINNLIEKFGGAKQLAIHVLRTGLGVQLVILAVHNKFMNPSMAVEFLNQHQYINFMQYIFSDFSNYHFAISAGLAETFFGLLLITNVCSRLSCIMLLFFFTLSSILLGIHEIAGHVPILIVLVLLLGYPVKGFNRFVFTKPIGFLRKFPDVIRN